MGQQQLLLLVLGIVIVGIAVVAGIQAFSEGKIKAENDAVAAEAMRYASDIQAWALKPAAFGGGASGQIGDVDWQKIGISAPDSTNNQYMTANACYDLTGTGGEAVITGYRLDGNCTGTDVIGTVTITGSSPNDVVWAAGAAEEEEETP